MKLEICDSKWDLDYITKNSDSYFLIEENNAKVGKDNQSIRGLNNFVPLRTKKGPNNKRVAFLSDDEYEKNVVNIDEDILFIKKLLINGEKVLLSSSGYGVGVKENAPKTYEYLKDCFKYNLGFNIETGSRFFEIPTQESMENEVKLEIGLDSYNLIKENRKMAITSDKQYQKGDILSFKTTKNKSFLVCRVTYSYGVEFIDNESWSHLEGNKTEKPDGLFQTQFQFILMSNDSGTIIPNRLYLDEKRVIENKTKKVDNSNTVASDKTEIPVVESKYVDIKDYELLHQEILKLRKEIREIKKPFFIKFKDYIKELFRRKDIYYILEKSGINGEVEKLNVETHNMRNTYYNVKCEEYTYILAFREGVFKNDIFIMLKIINS